MNGAVIGVRMLIDLCCMLAFLVALVMWSCGAERKAVPVGVMAVVIAWSVRPDTEQVEAFAEFQAQRVARLK